MQTFRERLESNNLDPEIDDVFVENILDKFEEIYKKFPTMSYEDIFVVSEIYVMDDAFYMNDEPVNEC